MLMAKPHVRKSFSRFPSLRKLTSGDRSEGSPGGSAVKNLPAKAGDAGGMGSIPESGSFLGGANGNLL